MHTRMLFLLSGLGLFTGCGKDEPVASLIGDGEPDAGEDTSSNTSVSPGTVSPTSSPSVAPTVSPVNPGPATSNLAAACASDAECGVGMKCLTSAGTGLFGGGPPNGFCTIDCTADPTMCGTIESGAICIGVDDELAYCFPGCEPGGAPATKCQGRLDVACDYTTLTSTFCRPMCGTDADCDGRKCDIGTGVCLDELAGPGDVGAACDPSLNPSPDCKSGRCLGGDTPETETTGTCSGLCTVGAQSCGVEGGLQNGKAWCSPFDAASTPGDMGLCTQICDCDDQCLHEDFRCLTFSEDAQAAYGIDGVCVEFDRSTDNLSAGFELGNACEPDDGGVDGGDGAADSASDAQTNTIDGAADAMSVSEEASVLDAAGDASNDAN